MRLNPLKCDFAVEVGKFLGFMITQRRVEANPEKCEAILQMKSPRSVKDVQRLAGRLTALSRFLGASAAKALPFFNLMRKGIMFEWTPACEQAFKQFKEIISTPPVFTRPRNGEALYLYLAVTDEAVAGVLADPSWMNPIVDFLEKDKLPSNEKEAKAIRREADKEVHEGCCGHHIGGKALARKLIRAGYYWSSMMKDSKEFVRKCIKCQENANFHKAPATELSLLTASRPFSHWGVDFLGPFSVGPGQVNQVVTRFGIPEVVISDNGTQFTDKKFGEFLAGLGIKKKFSSMEHPQTNGQVEAANKIILLSLKK
nr:uncharacterized protein LOC112733791 [Arachis hypogaea]